jgi:hypothetical protein
MKGYLESFCSKISAVAFLFRQALQYLENSVTADETGFIKLLASGQLGSN